MPRRADSCWRRSKPEMEVPQDLFAQGLRVAELLLEAAAEPEHLRPALRAMTEMMNADAGVLVCTRGGESSAGPLVLSSVDLSDGASDAHALLQLLDHYRERVLPRAGDPPYADAEFRPVETAQAESGTDAPPQFNRLHCCMGHVDAGDGGACVVGFSRSNESGFDPARMRCVASLLPHLRKSLAINNLFESMRAVNAAVMQRFERYHVGVVLVDATGMMLYHNSAARRLLGSGEGLRADALGRLTAHAEEDSAALQLALRERIGHNVPVGDLPPGLLSISRGAGAAPLSVAITPCRDARGPLREEARGGAVVMIHDPDHPQMARRDAVAQIYGLNRHEAELACAIAEGASLEEFARQSGRSFEAVRSQLKRIFRKTGVSRQAELVRLVLRGPAAMVQ